MARSTTVFYGGLCLSVLTPLTPIKPVEVKEVEAPNRTEVRGLRKELTGVCLQRSTEEVKNVSYRSYGLHRSGGPERKRGTRKEGRQEFLKSKSGPVS